MRYLYISLLLWALVGISHAEAQEKIRLTNGEWKPYQSQELPNYGPYSEIARLAFAKVGIDVEFGFFPWNRAMKLVELGKWDGTFFWVATPERRENYLLSVPVINLKEVIFYSKKKPLSVQSLSDFSGLTMGRIQSSAFGAQFNDMIERGEISLQVVPTNETLFKMLDSGRVDFIPELINSGYDAIDDLPDYVNKANFDHLDQFSYTWSSHLLISKNIPKGPYYIEQFNKGFQMLVKDGSVARILDPILKPKRYQTKP